MLLEAAALGRTYPTPRGPNSTDAWNGEQWELT